MYAHVCACVLMRSLAIDQNFQEKYQNVHFICFGDVGLVIIFDLFERDILLKHPAVWILCFISVFRWIRILYDYIHNIELNGRMIFLFAFLFYVYVKFCRHFEFLRCDANIYLIR